LDPLLSFLIVLTVTFFALTLYAIIQENSVLLNIRATRFLSLKILDTTSASSLFVTLLGALLLRHQFVLGFRPRIVYKSMTTVKQNTRNVNEFCECWQVRLRNVGVGAAIINRCEFEFEMSSAKSNSSLLAFNDVVKEIAKCDLVNERDYWLENITSGFALSPNEDYNVFEIRTEHMKKLKTLNMILHFQGFLGGKYRRLIRFMPREYMNN
jgi:hypothetical protein